MRNAIANMQWLYQEGSGESKLQATWVCVRYLIMHPVDTFTTSGWGAGG